MDLQSHIYSLHQTSNSSLYLNRFLDLLSLLPLPPLLLVLHEERIELLLLLLLCELLCVVELPLLQVPPLPLDLLLPFPPLELPWLPLLFRLEMTIVELPERHEEELSSALLLALIKCQYLPLDDE